MHAAAFCLLVSKFRFLISVYLCLRPYTFISRYDSHFAIYRGNTGLVASTLGPKIMDVSNENYVAVQVTRTVQLFE